MPQTPHEVFDGIVKNVHVLLKPMGYAKSGHTFRRVGDETTLILSLPKDHRYTRQDTIPFLIEMAVVINDIYEVFGRPADVRKALSAHAHVRWQAGADDRGNNWEIIPAGDGKALTDDVISRVRDTAIPFLDQYSTKAAIVAAWRTGDGLGQSDYRRRVLLARIDGTVVDDDAPKHDKDTMLAAFRAGDWLGFPEHTAKEMLAFLEKDAARRAAKKPADV